MPLKIRSIVNYILVSITTAIVVVLIVYLTPLKWANIIEPKIKDVLPVLFYKEYRKDPQKYVFIDVRPADIYAAEHAEGSINIPLHLLYDERKNLPKKGKMIVLICGGGRASGVAYSYLEHYGFRNIRRISGGIEAWEDNGLPIIETTIHEDSLDQR